MTRLAQISTVPHNLLEGYHSAAARDELLDPTGNIRPHWDFVFRAIESMGPEQISSRQDDIQRFLKENGVTYNVYGEGGGKERAWPLDILPVLMDSRDWAPVERGLIQRAELFDLILQDLYGPAKLLSDGIIPPEIIFEHPGFLRSCVGIVPRNYRFLHFYAADLARKSDGTFSVLSDRIQSASGAGYALENRIVLSRTLPSLYRDSHVHRLALFFRTLRNHINSYSGNGNRIVLLTPGPENETYFEQAFLANYLGFNLVQGSDLTVKDAKVYLKTLNGLRPIDGIFRRIDDIYADPLELKSDSLLGVAGLLQCMRNGAVAVINPPGTGVLENPAFCAFLNNISKYLTGHDLYLQDVQTYWCGDSLDQVLPRLHELVIKPIFSSRQNGGTLYGNTLSKQALSDLADRIRAKPARFVAQEYVDLSTAPLWKGGRLQPSPMVVRGFACAREDSFMVMPGGLVRVSPDLDSYHISNQRGGVSKDLWILASEPEKQVTLISPVASFGTIVRSGGEIPSRIADNLFWIGRYAERTESLARILREIQLRLVEMQGNEQLVDSLLRALESHTGHFDPAFLDLPANSPEVEEKLRAIVYDVNKLGGLRYNIASLTGAARSLRERLSEDAWRTLNRMEPEVDNRLNGTLEMLENLLMYLASFSGFVSESMTRGQGFRFLEIGRRIERGIIAADLLRSVTGQTLPDAAWEQVLRIQNSYMTYRRRYRSGIAPVAVLDLLLYDESNPRSILHQVLRLEELTKGLPQKKDAGKSTEHRAVLNALSILRLADGGSRTENVDVAQLHQLLSQEKFHLRSVSESMTATYFSYVETQQALESSEWSATA